MSESMKTEAEHKVAAIGELIPGLMAQRRCIMTATGMPPDAVVLPSDLDPGPYEGDDATHHPATLLGLPIIWGDRVALVYNA